MYYIFSICFMFSSQLWDVGVGLGPPWDPLALGPPPGPYVAQHNLL
jgi:hypothetical protein